MKTALIMEIILLPQIDEDSFDRGSYSFVTDEDSFDHGSYYCATNR